jgi:hypothetical protein
VGKGLKSGRHCALSSLLVLAVVLVVVRVVIVAVVVVVVAVVGLREKEREDEEVLPANANLLIPSVPGSLCSKQIRRTPRHPRRSPPSLVRVCHLPFRRENVYRLDKP